MNSNASDPVIRSQNNRLMVAMILNTILWSSGHGLTSGAFLNYFAKDLGADANWMALILVTPDLITVCSLFSRPLLATLRKRRALWIALTLMSRLALMGIPLLAFHRLMYGPGIGTSTYLAMLCGCLAVSSLLQVISATLYHAWLADLVTPPQWGRVFAWRAIATLAVLLVTTIPFASLRDSWAKSLEPEALLYPYIVIFLVGNLLVMASVFPFLFIADGPSRAISGKFPSINTFCEAFADPNRRWLLAHSYVLAGANGFTQAVLFEVLRRLNVSLLDFQSMVLVMLFLQIPCSALGASASRIWGMKPVLFLGTLIASLGMLFWIAGIVWSRQWIWGAYVVWGAFGAVNLVGPNLMLALSPRHDSEMPIALFRLCPGLVAGLSGLAGAWLFSHGTVFSINDSPIDPAIVCLAISFIGRFLAALLVLPIREPTLQDESTGLTPPSI